VNVITLRHIKFGVRDPDDIVASLGAMCNHVAPKLATRTGNEKSHCTIVADG
jgi:hypothetical protein